MTNLGPEVAKLQLCFFFYTLKDILVCLHSLALLPAGVCHEKAQSKDARPHCQQHTALSTSGSSPVAPRGTWWWICSQRGPNTLQGTARLPHYSQPPLQPSPSLLHRDIPGREGPRAASLPATCQRYLQHLHHHPTLTGVK